MNLGDREHPARRPAVWRRRIRGDTGFISPVAARSASVSVGADGGSTPMIRVARGVPGGDPPIRRAPDGRSMSVRSGPARTARADVPDRAINAQSDRRRGSARPACVLDRTRGERCRRSGHHAMMARSAPYDEGCARSWRVMGAVGFRSWPEFPEAHRGGVGSNGPVIAAGSGDARPRRRVARAGWRRRRARAGRDPACCSCLLELQG